MKSRFSPISRVIAMILAIVLIPQLLQFDALAEGMVHTVKAAETTESSNSTEEVTTVLGEDESRREESVKHFILSNGTRQAVIYSEPVHYMKNGKWHDIDNTL